MSRRLSSPQNPSALRCLSEILHNHMDPQQLAVLYFAALNKHPVRTKALTSAVLSGLTELTATAIAGEKGEILTNRRIPHMVLYGLVVAGPLSHYLYDGIHRVFRNRRGLVSKLLQIAAVNVVVNPILCAASLTAMAIIAGARSIKELKARFRAAYWPMVRSTWITSPILIAFAIRYIPRMAWTPTFSFSAFFLNVYQNVLVKSRAIARRSPDDRRDPE